MPPRRSPYAVLGLRPGADRAAVERAYRHLIKRHHPDLPGGDPAFAAELNRAYALLRHGPAAARAPAPALASQGLKAPDRRGGRGRLAGLLMVVAAGAVLFLAPPSTLNTGTPGRQAAIAPPATRAAEPQPAIPDLPGVPDEDAVEAGVQAARRLAAGGGAREAVRFSRTCEQDLRTYPSPALLDHCVAFDAASALLGGAAPDARFRAEDMAARHMGAALRIADDPLLAEERIERVRRQAGQLLLLRPVAQP